ncbi:hypothetical protein [Halomonas sp. PGE1]|uniref:hypothetical protein n=1 Tax=Halomonas sp. PGE1 TaxID=2730360 RepID=UPI0014756288|nr:hypothetical protein [Halomonas sp. PGE1]QJQ98938.1 hypothetical protein HIR79_09700 [Halomonas sp. PGE1]
MQDLLLPLAMTGAFGAFIGTLYRLSRRPGYQRPLLFPLVGLAAGIIGFVIYRLLVATTGAPLWLLPLLVVLQVWLWLGPFGPASRADGQDDPGR